MKPVFLLSLPRSGSTLLQRVLASHSRIATAAEPWLLLPLIYPLRSAGVAAIYEHQRLFEAVEDFCGRLPNRRSDYLGAVAEMVTGLYAKIGTDADYFLDKTPRYHLILDELRESFPDARFVLLWRNPLAVAASMIDTWADGKWNLHWFQVDLFDGLAALHRFAQQSGSTYTAHRFEDFVSEPEAVCRQILEHLGLPFEDAMLTNFSRVELQGRMGDPTGVKAYKSISTGSLDKWKTTLGNPLRKRWARRYLKWIGPDRLEAMGYSMAELERELDDTPTTLSRVGSDIARMPYGKLYLHARRRCHGGYSD